MSGAWGMSFLVFALTVTISSCSTVGPNTRTSTKADGLSDGDVAAIILGILFFLLTVATIVLCFMYYKGYIGHREEQVIPFLPAVDTTPDSLRKCSEAAFDREKKMKYQHYNKEANPIIYVHDDIYYPPKSRPLPTDDGALYKHEMSLTTPHTPRRRTRRQSREERHSKSLSLPRVSHGRRHKKQLSLPRSKSVEPQPTIPSYPDDAVFIPEKGGMKFTMYYKAMSPYRDKRDLTKTL